MGKRREYIGTVISDKMQKTIIVRILQMAKHHKYNRIIREHTKFKVHDEKGIAKMDDVVRIEETRPLSKDKRFRLVEVIKKAQIPHVEIKEEVK
ncbi:MAG: 30S ribosomal protein S17 [Candidatus Omnitrophica bacterium]|nr:30S ribosomal protein S17 [Candidatus Omnitrophota bacterium]